MDQQAWPIIWHIMIAACKTENKMLAVNVLVQKAGSTLKIFG